LYRENYLKYLNTVTENTASTRMHITRKNQQLLFVPMHSPHKNKFLNICPQLSINPADSQHNQPANWGRSTKHKWRDCCDKCYHYDDDNHHHHRYHYHRACK